MSSLKIKPGSRMQIAFDVALGKEPSFDKICTFKKELDESAFLVSIPMSEGKPLQVREDQKLLLRVSSGRDEGILAGYVDGIVKEGFTNCWKIRRVTEMRQFFQRADVRYKVSLKCSYLQDTWSMNADGRIVPDDAMTVDISYGGIAIFESRRLTVGEVARLNLPRVGTTKDGNEVNGIVGVVCWQREAPKGSPFRMLTGLQFRFAEQDEKDVYIRYVDNLRKAFAL